MGSSKFERVGGKKQGRLAYYSVAHQTPLLLVELRQGGPHACMIKRCAICLTGMAPQTLDSLKDIHSFSLQDRCSCAYGGDTAQGQQAAA